VGTVAANLMRAQNQAGESILGDIVADAQLAATRAAADGGAVIAFTNPGGVRTDIFKREDRGITFAEVYACQPFNNSLVTLTLTGVQIKSLPAQQWLKPE